MSAGFVIDCSVALSWGLADEHHPLAEALLDRLVDEPALVPPLFHLEVANGLLTAERRKRVTPAAAKRIAGLIAALQLLTDETPMAALAAPLAALARAHQTTIYDATYLELAIRADLPLATLDARLRTAARSAGVALIK